MIYNPVTFGKVTNIMSKFVTEKKEVALNHL